MYNLRRENIQYDAWLYWELTPKCNLSCVYCPSNELKRKIKRKIKESPKKTLAFLRKRRLSQLKSGIQGILNSNLSSLPRKISIAWAHRKGQAPKIDIPALIETLNKTNKTFLIGFTGGDPFLCPNIIEACQEISKNHYIYFTTNLVSDRVKDFAENIDPGRVSAIIASAHINELESRNLLDKYIKHFQLCQQKGFTICAIEVAHPTFVNKVDKYKSLFNEKGIDLHFNVYSGLTNKGRLPYDYTQEELQKFGLTKDNIKAFLQQGQPCNASYNVGIVDPNGDISPCYAFYSKKSMGNIYEGIKFSDNLINCPAACCGCPLNKYDTYLFEKAVNETRLKRPPQSHR